MKRFRRTGKGRELGQTRDLEKIVNIKTDVMTREI